MFLFGSLFGKDPSYPWEVSPQFIREKINEQIMSTEAFPSSVGSVQDVTLSRENGSTPIRVYQPIERNLPGVILLIHGGAWVAGSLDTHDYLARYLCAETGTSVVSVGYLNAPEGKYPLPLEQCYDTLLWIKSHMQDVSIAVVGDSSGGNLAAALCLMARDRLGPKIQLQVLINPAPDLTCNGTLIPQNDALDILRWQAVQYLSDPEDAGIGYVSPLVAKDLSQLPKALVILAENDSLRESGQKYADRLSSAGVETEVYCQKNIGHLAGDGARASTRARESLDVAICMIKDSFSRILKDL